MTLLERAGAVALSIGVWAAFTIIVALPLGYAAAYVVAEANVDSIRAAFGASQLDLLLTSLSVALPTAALALLMGVPAAFALDRAGRFLHWMGLGAILLLMFVPVYVYTLAWTELGHSAGLMRRLGDAGGFEPGGVVSISLILAMRYFPIAAVLTLAGLRRLPTNAAEAAQIHLGAWRRFYRVYGLLLAPYTSAGFVMVFLLALTEFAAPSLVQVETYPVAIHTRYAAFHDVSGGFLLGIPLVLAGGIVCLAWLMFARRGATGTLVSARLGVETGLGKIGKIVWNACLAVLLAVTFLVPVAWLVYESLPPESYTDAWHTAREEYLATCLIALLSAAFLTVMGLALAVESNGSRIKRSITSVSAIPFLMSGPALGIALVLAWNHDGLRGAVYDSAAILIVAYAARYLWFAWLGSRAAQRSVAPSMAEAASAAGLPAWRRWTHIMLPLMAPMLTATFAVLFLLSFADADMPVMLAPPGITTLPSRIFGLLHYGPSRLVAALCVIMVSTLAIALGLAAMLFTRLERRRAGAGV